jgi:hypothetical protein
MHSDVRGGFKLLSRILAAAMVGEVNGRATGSSQRVPARIKRRQPAAGAWKPLCPARPAFPIQIHS